MPGLVFDRSKGHQFKVLSSPSGDFYLNPNLMAVVRRCQKLAYFLPSAELSDACGKVVFTRYSGDNELLTKTLGLDEPGAVMPESAYSRLQEAMVIFKAMANDVDLTPDESRFIADFKLPDRRQFPAAYRILKTSWYTPDRLFVLWGLEPSSGGGVPVIKILAGAGNAPSTPPRSTDGMGLDAGARPEVYGSSGAPLIAGATIPERVASDDVGGTIEGGRSWRGCLWLLLPLILLLLVLLFTQCVPVACSDRSQVSNRVFDDKPKSADGPTLVPDLTPAPAPEPKPTPAPGPKPMPEPGPERMPEPAPSPKDKPKEEALRKKADELPPPKWWHAQPDHEEKKTRNGRVMPLPKRQPKSSGSFEVYIHEPTDFIQRPPAAGVHLGLKHHGDGQIKDVTWTLSDGVKEHGEFLDELVPFDRDLIASTEIDVTYTYVDANGVESTDGFSFRYVLQGKVTFSEQIGAADDKRTPAEREDGRKKKKDEKAQKEII